MMKLKGCSMGDELDTSHMRLAKGLRMEEVSHASPQVVKFKLNTTTTKTRTENHSHALTNNLTHLLSNDLTHEIIKFTIFVYSNNLFSRSTLKLACYICLHQLISYKEAAALLNISKAAIAQLLQKSSKLFSFKVVSLSGWGSGGREKRIKLSKEAEQYRDLILALGRELLGREFEDCKRKVVLPEEDKQSNLKLEKAKHALAQQWRKHGSWKAIPRERVMFWCKETGLSEEDLKKETHAFLTETIWRRARKKELLAMRRRAEEESVKDDLKLFREVEG